MAFFGPDGPGSAKWSKMENAQNRRKIDFFENRSGTAKVTYGVEI